MVVKHELDNNAASLENETPGHEFSRELHFNPLILTKT